MVMIEIMVFCVVISAMVGYQHFRGPFYLHLQGEVLQMNPAWSTTMVVSYRITTWHHNPKDHDVNIWKSRR
jgi:hypothetical protein